MTKLEEDALEVCRMVMDIKYCMMFEQIHADFSSKEILARYNVSSVQELALITEEKAENILKNIQPN